MKPKGGTASLRCAIYTRVSTEHGLEQEFNSLDNQREASEAYIKSQAHEAATRSGRRHRRVDRRNRLACPHDPLDQRWPTRRSPRIRSERSPRRFERCAGGLAMRPERSRTSLRCAVYTRVSTEHGLEREFNSLDNQREASEAYIKSQTHEGWKLIRNRYDDGGYSGGSLERPALKRLLDDVRAHRIDVIVVYRSTG